MNEILIEEKAKAYDEALERAKGLVDFCSDNELKTLEYVFPELKESEDDRIRKALIDFFQDWHKTKPSRWSIPVSDVIVWLEKQGKKKPVNKVEPKFKVGDWIINNDVYGDVPVKIKEIGNYLYLCERQDGVIIELNKNAVLKEFKHWDITDAKDGDVLAVEPIEGFPSSFIAIYKKQNEEDFDSYCFVGFDGKFYENEYGHSTEDIHPATKEQREQLEKAMIDAGWEFDFEEKELKRVGQNITWSEEDDRNLSIAIQYVFQHGYLSTVNWLKSLKQRIGR